MRRSFAAAVGLLALLAAQLTGQAPPRAYVFALDGTYAALDLATVTIGAPSAVWQKAAPGLERVADLHYMVYGVVDDVPHGRVLLQVVRKQTGYDDGFLVFDLTDERLVGA